MQLPPWSAPALSAWPQEVALALAFLPPRRPVCWTGHPRLRAHLLRQAWGRRCRGRVPARWAALCSAPALGRPLGRRWPPLCKALP